MMSHHNLKRQYILTTLVISGFFILFFALFGCGKKAQVVGEISDGFGLPLEGVVVSIKDTTFRTTTDGRGRYSVGYVPGKVKVVISKDGYTSAELLLDIATESTFPARPVTLYKIPTNKGIFLLGRSDYVPLKKAKIYIKEEESGYKRTYWVDGKFTLLEGGERLKFWDTDGEDNQLFRVTEKDVLLIREWGREDKFKILKEEVKQIAEGIYLREVSLGKGKYAFTSEQYALIAFAQHPVAEPVYPFEVK